ncbi:hypothetical protein AYO38_09500 [bacterium SCGC AG-212-C10]|nr:hypothetical protein AYO38_09500 [bacterium SCGC AG-212-C10]
MNVSRLRDLMVIAAMLLFAAREGLPYVTAFAQEDGGDVVAPAAVPLANNFTYQGKLTQANSNASGPFDFQFALYDAASDGVQVGPTVSTPGLNVTNGLFSASLAFSANAFGGDSRWLEVRVKAVGAPTYDVVGRQELTATPYALYAKNIPLAGDGTASTAARSDHNHFSEAWTGNGNGLSVTSSGSGDAISGTSSSTNGVGLAGINTAGTAIVGISEANGYGAVFGTNNAGYGVVGDSLHGSYAGVLGRDPNGVGVIGRGVNGVKGEGVNGVIGNSTAQGSAGVYGTAFAGSNCTNAGPAALCYGVIGIAESPNTAGVGVMGYGTNTGVWARAASGNATAAVFDGRIYVNGLIDAPAGSVKIPNMQPDLNNVRNIGFAGLQFQQMVAGSFVNGSDIRMKHDVAAITEGLDAVLALRPVSFVYNEGDDRTQLGLIAQEVQPIVPEVVSVGEDEAQTLGIDYAKLVPVLIKAIQEQQAEIDALKAQLGQ